MRDKKGRDVLSRTCSRLREVYGYLKDTQLCEMGRHIAQQNKTGGWTWEELLLNHGYRLAWSLWVARKELRFEYLPVVDESLT